jgi:Tol biopolymer transport system component
MILSAGTRLGPYEILSLIGSGGMGEVYRARDTRLGRDVAVKILPPSVADNPSRRARFHREAQAISQLNHPHICAVHDVGEEDGLAYLVMEFIDGETLEHRLRLGRVAWSTAAAWTMQVASALDTAHRRGIVHRDLKPANIMLAESGVKLLDFGIAKLLLDTDAGGAGAAAAPTASLTGDQTIVGTLQYMSPEQLEGRAIDGRTDIFSLGATLYEMLTARKAFEGSSPASISAAILTADPPAIQTLDRSETVSPAALDHVLRRALAKDPDERWQTARDFMIEVRSLQEGHGPHSRAAVPRRRRPAGLLAVASVAAVAAVGTTTWWAATRAAGPPPPLPVEFTIAPPQGSRFTGGHGRLAVSRDGRRVAFVAGPEGGPGLLTWQDLGASTQQVLAGTEDANGIFWSSDGESLGYFVEGKLKRVAARGGPSEVIGDGRPPAPAAYWDGDVISFSQRDGWYRVKVPGGRPEKVSEVYGAMPRSLPGGRVMYLVNAVRPGAASLVVEGPGLREPVSLPVDSNAVYAGGHLLYRRGETLVAQPFDQQAVKFSGPPVPLVENIFYNPANGRTLFDASDTMVAFRTAPDRRTSWRDRSGALLGAFADNGRDWNPAVAPDASLRVAADRFDPKSDTSHIYVTDTSGRAIQVSRGQRERYPVWSWDAQWIAFTSVSNGIGHLRRVRASGEGSEEILHPQPGTSIVASMDYRRDYLVFQADLDLHALPLRNGEPIAGAAPIRLTYTDKEAEGMARVSPDGRWLAYAVGAHGQQQVWLQEFPEPKNPRPITTAGGFAPSWRQDGKELYYVAAGGTLTAMPVLNDQAMTFGPPVALFPFSIANAQEVQIYGASPDGQRFILNELSGAPEVITIILNWTARVR